MLKLTCWNSHLSKAPQGPPRPWVALGGPARAPAPAPVPARRAAQRSAAAGPWDPPPPQRPVQKQKVSGTLLRQKKHEYLFWVWPWPRAWAWDWDPTLAPHTNWLIALIGWLFERFACLIVLCVIVCLLIVWFFDCLIVSIVAIVWVFDCLIVWVRSRVGGGGGSPLPPATPSPTGLFWLFDCLFNWLFDC